MKKTPLPSPTSNKPQPATAPPRRTSNPASQTAEGAKASATVPRPPLQRQARSHSPKHDYVAPTPLRPVENQPTPTDENAARNDGSKQAGVAIGEGATGQASGNKGKEKNVATETADLEALRDAVNAKLRLSQQRIRLGSNSAGASPQSVGARRVSPIKEEEAMTSMSPSLDAAFSSPLPTGAQTTSTESTESSARTVRGSVPATPNQPPLRTPSYPFPYVPGTPRAWSSSFHQPFTTLSPTVSSSNLRESTLAREQTLSDTSTPGASATTFMPAGTSYHESEDAQYPTPSLYELVLLLNSEPGLDAWWNIVAKIMHECYGTERATLAVPADTADLENVPWGQKASFNISGVTESSSSSEAHANPHLPQQEARNLQKHSHEAFRFPQATPQGSSATPAGTHNGAERPRLDSRHSYAGYERERTDISGEGRRNVGRMSRPQGPLRTVSHAPQATPREEQGPFRQATPVSLQPPPDTPRPFSDPEFSSMGEDPPASPYVAVFPVLRALDHEPDPLIDNPGINRILERGKLVTLTRDYSTSSSKPRRDSGRPSSSDPSDSSSDSSRRPISSTTHSYGSSNVPPRTEDTRSRASNVARRAGDYFGLAKTTTDYEEYEQFPASPWAQSPAPSPAIQADSSENPFFASTNVDESSFNPTGSSQDYSQYGQVEAIGVDRASTITHIPLIHPLLSQPMQSFAKESVSSTPNEPRRSEKEQTFDPTSTSDPSRLVRKAPIAILSILSPNVPYPQNLTQSLRMLGPHLATSFSNAHQYTNAHRQAVHGHRRLTSGHRVGLAPLSDEPESTLDDLMHIDIDEIMGLATGSLTSPSDYSGRSRHSPGGSIAGTPGWDPSNVGFSSRHSVSGTPAHVTGAELVDSYFDAKKRSAASGFTSNAGLSQGGRDSPSLDLRTPSRRPVTTAATSEGDNVPTPKSEQKPKGRLTQRDQRDEKASSKPQQRRESPSRTGDISSIRRPGSRVASSQHQDRPDRRQHSLLHSYGADFSSTFQTLPAAATPAPRTPGPPFFHGRSSSASEAFDMPPPSERLLRTIIDSLPVQIFTAAPATGDLTWVNSKYLVYRGQDSRQIIQDPWQTIHPEDRAEYMDMWMRSMRTGQQFAQKVRLQRFDGQYRWFYVRATPLKDKRQNIVHWAGTNMDIHEQHVAEMNAARQQETAASEAKYRALANSSPQIVFAVNKAKGLTFCNSQWLSYSGQTEAQATGLGFMDYVHPEDLSKCRLPTFDEDGSTATNVPTTFPPEPKRTVSSRTSSDESDETTKAITSPGGASPTTIQLPQTKLSELASTGILKVSRDADGRPSYSTEVRLRSKDGNYRWHLVRVLLAEPVLRGEDDEETWYGTCTDINDHKLLEQTLKETMDAKSRFLSNMSHEIRTPLNGITGMVNLLIDSSLTTEQMEHVNIIRNSTEGLRSLINDILDLSKVEAGMINLTMDWLHVRSLIEEVNDLTSTMAIDKGLELNYVVEEDVPSMVKGDRFRIRQVLLNVIGNAIKFTESGEVFVKCQTYRGAEISHDRDEAVLQFDVIDTGRGFTEKEAEYLFKRFSQIDGSSTRQHGGTGLGLAISMQLVELHGGKMKATSVPGKGSTFTFTVKFSIPSEENHPPMEAVTPGMFSQVQTPAVTPGPLPPPSTRTSLFARLSESAVESPLLGMELSESPAPLQGSPGVQPSPQESSGSSSIRTSQTSIRSQRSSASSFNPDVAVASAMNLEIPSKSRVGRTDSTESLSRSSNDSASTVRPFVTGSGAREVSPLAGGLHPPMYSILVVCPLAYSREATVKHIEMTLPKTIPHQITARESLAECREMIGGADPVIFTHVVLVLRSAEDVIAFMDEIFNSGPHSLTSIVVILDLAQKREIMKQASGHDYAKLTKERRLRFIFKPLKPSKIADIFDPEKERETSTNRSQDSVQQVAVSQKQVFEDMKRQLGNRGFRVLLVEDNATNQMVLLRLFRKVAIETETVLDGVQCTDKVFSQPHGYYSIILCDLHMPNKDGYQTCKEIRRWERKNKYPYLPIIALSANVLGDVYSKCVEAGFNSYVTKPVDFKELSVVMRRYLDPADPKKPHEFMRPRRD